MERDNRLFDDLARVANGALSSFSALKDEAEARLRDQMERILERMDLVRRDEFEAVQAMAVRAREENAALSARLDALEATTPAKAAAKKRPRSKPAATAKRRSRKSAGAPKT
ncbi:MAG: accessory factor UbiK family protein [Alphaproteobacteria bacterium]|jgi:hypothetical protein|nr:accessory factor UbiK family protein [Alphaproteobacteria bacterium]MDP6518026.1 accessory factor UbiK family protein [Alphaproteobacteria bacterium]